MDIKADNPSHEHLSPRGHNPLYVESTDNNVAALWAAHNGGGEAIHAHNRSSNQATIAAYNLNSESNSAVIFARKEGSNGHAGFFVGNVWVDRNLGVKGNLGVEGNLSVKGQLRTEGHISTSAGFSAKQGMYCEGGMTCHGNLIVYGRIQEIHLAADGSKPETEPESESLLERVSRLEEEVAALRSRLTSK